MTRRNDGRSGELEKDLDTYLGLPAQALPPVDEMTAEEKEVARA